MDTVNFKCGHCGQTIAVLKAHVGQQVRCPHCQQAVVAPPTESPPSDEPPSAPERTFALVTREESESIFSEPTASDDVFGQPGPGVELPLDMTAGLSALPPTVPNMELGPSHPAAAVQQDATQTHVLSEPLPGTAPAADPVTSNVPAVEAPAAWSPLTDGAPTGADSVHLPVRPRVDRGWHIALVIIPLVSYAILATIAVAILYFRLRDQELEKKETPRDPRHQLEHLPDLQGDNPTGRAPKKRRIDRPQEWYYTAEPSTVLRLDETATIGDVQITPLRVERGPIETVEIGRDKPEKLPGEALKLVLRIKNVSKDLRFYPLDRSFNRFYSASGKNLKSRYSDPTTPPLTALDVGRERFYGGPAGYWNPKTDPVDADGANEAVVGQNYDTSLAPGGEMKTFICTDPEDKTLQAALADYKGTLRWRVHLRRGAVDVKGRRIPATAVIGVEFTGKDIKPAGEAVLDASEKKERFLDDQGSAA